MMTSHAILPHGAAPSRFARHLEANDDAGGRTLFDETADGGCDAARAADLLDAGRVPLEQVVREAREVTDRHFGRRVILYAPCYLSSHCVGHCLYCGFRYGAPGPRRILGVGEAVAECAWLAERGIRRVVLVAGDYPSLVTPDYIERILQAASQILPEIDLELAPAPVRDYRRWAMAGAGGVVCYQEVYERTVYDPLHPRGPKASWDFRLGTLERAGAAGLVRLGAGCLLGLSPAPRREILALIAHARFLQALHPRAQVGVSLPRLCPAVPEFRPAAVVGDEDLIRAYAVARIALPRANLVLSTREPAPLRRRLLACGITQMSAGSVTVPGGYTATTATEAPGHERGTDQFPVSDRRGVAEVAADLERLGYSPVWTALPPD